MSVSFEKSEEEWRAILTQDQFHILREKGTEPRGTGHYDKFYEKGVYNCAGCGTPLYKSTTKFDSGCGWPAFFQGLPNAINRSPDPDGRRTEITCASCGGHLGHVFKGEGHPVPTDERHCVNSVSIKFVTTPASADDANENTCEITVETSEGEIFAIGQGMLFSASSISLSPEELRCLSIDEDINEECSERAAIQEPVNKPEVMDSLSCALEALTNAKSDSQWKGFLKKIKKGPHVHLHTFHPSMPHLPSIKKLSRPKSIRDPPYLPSLTPNIDADLSSCFETSWKNFSLSDLQAATNNFSHDNLIGEGGYSEVYKGHLGDGQLVAIKRLIRGTQEEMTADYLSELGILVHVNHPNISNVIGYGVEGGMHLILPLSPHGSLASLLNGKNEKLAWSFRYNIAIGIASGLSYLHEGCQRRIIHRDIKTANVLLTEDFEPKISDFGLAKWLPDQWTHLTVSQFEGTFGYLPPEFFMHGIVDEKTDVYAYGVLLLELISGRPALDEAHNSVVMWAKPRLISKNIPDLVDPSLDGVYDMDQINMMVMVASLSINQNSSDRPQMSQVLRMLRGDEITLQIRKKFQKRPALRRYPLELIQEEECNSSKSSTNKNKKMEPVNGGSDSN